MYWQKISKDYRLIHLYPFKNKRIIMERNIVKTKYTLRHTKYLSEKDKKFIIVFRVTEFRSEQQQQPKYRGKTKKLRENRNSKAK